MVVRVSVMFVVVRGPALCSVAFRAGATFAVIRGPKWRLECRFYWDFFFFSGFLCDCILIQHFLTYSVVFQASEVFAIVRGFEGYVFMVAVV